VGVQLPGSPVVYHGRLIRISTNGTYFFVYLTEAWEENIALRCRAFMFPISYAREPAWTMGPVALSHGHSQQCFRCPAGTKVFKAPCYYFVLRLFCEQQSTYLREQQSTYWLART